MIQSVAPHIPCSFCSSRKKQQRGQGKIIKPLFKSPHTSQWINSDIYQCVYPCMLSVHVGMCVCVCVALMCEGRLAEAGASWLAVGGWVASQGGGHSRNSRETTDWSGLFINALWSLSVSGTRAWKAIYLSHKHTHTNTHEYANWLTTWGLHYQWGLSYSDLTCGSSREFGVDKLWSASVKRFYDGD